MRTLCFVAWSAVFAAPARAQPPADDAAFAAWERRQGVPATKYALRWELIPTAGRPGAPKPGEDGAYTGSGTAILDVPTGRVRVDQDERVHFTNRPERLSRLRQTFRFDGRDQSAFHVIDFDAAAAPAEPKVETAFVGDWGEAMRWPIGFDPLAWAHGLVSPGRPEDGPFPQAWRPAAGRFRATGREDMAGRTCVVFRDTSAPNTTLWVDAADGAVAKVRLAFASGGGRETAVTYRDTPHGRLPAGWEESTARVAGPPVVGRRVLVGAVTFEPAAATDFQLAPSPGTIVEGRGRWARVAADGTLEPITPPPAVPTGETAAGVWGLVGWSGAAGLGVAAALAGGLVWTRVRRSRRAPAPPLA